MLKDCTIGKNQETTYFKKEPLKLVLEKPKKFDNINLVREYR